MKISSVVKLAFFAAIYGIAIPASAIAQSGGVDFVTYTTKPDPRIESLVRKGLNDKIEGFYEEFGYIPYLQYATADLNNDGNPEIIARFTEEYAFRDSNNNVDTHIFAYTTRGLIEIFEAQAFDIAIGRRDESGLREIIAFQGSGREKYDLYGWDNRRYVKK